MQMGKYFMIVFNRKVRDGFARYAGGFSVGLISCGLKLDFNGGF
jgi:hypothetical protein